MESSNNNTADNQELKKQKNNKYIEQLIKLEQNNNVDFDIEPRTSTPFFDKPSTLDPSLMNGSFSEESFVWSQSSILDDFELDPILNYTEGIQDKEKHSRPSGRLEVGSENNPDRVSINSEQESVSELSRLVNKDDSEFDGSPRSSLNASFESYDAELEAILSQPEVGENKKENLRPSAKLEVRDENQYSKLEKQQQFPDLFIRGSKIMLKENIDKKKIFGIYKIAQQ